MYNNKVFKMQIKHKNYLLLFGLTFMISACHENSTLNNDSQNSIPEVVQDVKPSNFEDKKQISDIEDNESILSNKTVQLAQVNSQKFTANYLKENYPDNLYEIYDYDVNADSVKDKIFSTKNDERNTYQGNDLIVYLGQTDGVYKLSLKTTNFTDETGWFLTDIYPFSNQFGFILKTSYSPHGHSNRYFYFSNNNNNWKITKYISDGALNTGEEYYCIEDKNFNLKESTDLRDFSFDNITNNEEILEYCPLPPIEYIVKAGKAEILNEKFDSRSPPNYYVKGDTFEAFDQNEDWVKVSYKNGTKFGWIDKRNLKPISD